MLVPRLSARRTDPGALSSRGVLSPPRDPRCSVRALPPSTVEALRGSEGAGPCGGGEEECVCVGASGCGSAVSAAEKRRSIRSAAIRAWWRGGGRGAWLSDGGRSVNS